MGQQLGCGIGRMVSVPAGQCVGSWKVAQVPCGGRQDMEAWTTIMWLRCSGLGRHEAPIMPGFPDNRRGLLASTPAAPHPIPISGSAGRGVLHATSVPQP